MKKNIPGFLALFCAFLFLLYTPIQSNFALHVGELDLRHGILDVSVSFTNTLHIVGYGLISILILMYFTNNNSSKKYAKVFCSVFFFSILVEFTQIFFVQGNFRLRDLISNITGIMISFSLFKIFSKHFENRSSKVLFFLLIFLIQIFVAILLHFLFKELSVVIGGEELRKYL